jgi:hypothetical protein
MIALLALLAAAAQPAPFLREEETPLLRFRYGWAAQAQAIPALRAELRRRMNAAHAEAIASARETREVSREAGVPFHQELRDEVWSVAAANGRFLSLTADNRTDQNGAHPNRDFDSLLWDRARRRAVAVPAVLGPSRLAAMSGRYCARLAAAVRARGGEPPARCPALGERVLAFADRDRDGRFDALHVLIAPYVAASYADGAFVVDVPFAPGDLAGLAAPDRAAFESR